MNRKTRGQKASGGKCHYYEGELLESGGIGHRPGCASVIGWVKGNESHLFDSAIDNGVEQRNIHYN